MSELDIGAMSLKDLLALQKSVDKAIATFGDRRKAEARAKLESIAKEMGFSLADLAGGESARPSRARAAAKYRHPENPDVTWSGRGRRPHWFSDHLAAGKDPSELAI